MSPSSEITERKADEALRESEQWFRNMADSAPVLIWMSGPDKLCTWFNEQWLKFVGRSMAQELGDGWAQNVHPEDLDRCLRTYTASFDARESFSMEYRLRRHDGQWRWLLDNGVPRYDPANNFAGYIGSCVDVTSVKILEEQRSIAERKLRQRDQELAVLFDNSPDAVVRFDPNIRATHVNAAFERVTGIPAKDALRVGRELPIPISVVETTERLVRTVFTRGQPCTEFFSYVTPRGLREFEVRYIPEFSADQSIAAVFSIGRDITDQITAERALRQSEQDLSMLFDHSPDAIMRLDRKLRCLYVNTTWERRMGISRETARGKTGEVLGIPQAFVRAQKSAIRQVLRSRRPVTTELAYATRNGPIDYEIRHIPEFDDKGTISSFLFIGRDISVQKRLQRQAAAQARDIHALTASLMTAQEQERRRVAREIHDSLLQHLGVLAAEIANAGSDLLDSSPVKKRLQAAREHALRTANEARQLSHQLHPAIVEDLGLRRALQSLCVKISEEHGVAVKFRVRGPLPSIPLDAASCAYRVAQEALNNVVKHARAKNIDVLLAGRRTLQLSIRDKGIGFDPVAVQGVGGLGLISMRERARLANGELSVDAKPGHGTLIKLVLRLPEGALGGKRGSGLQTPSRRSG